MRLNPLEFFGLKVNKDPHFFIDEVMKITQIMHVNKEKSVELASYQLKDIAYG